MRRLGLFAVGACAIMLSVAFVDGQQPQPKGGFGGGFGFGKAKYQGPLAILNLQEVKKDLEISDEQMDKLPEEVLVAISKVLTDKQFKRFKQIDLQKKENNAFKDNSVQTALKMTPEQKKSILTIITDSDKEIADLAPKTGGGGKGGKGGKGGGGGFGGFGGIDTEKEKAIHKDAKEKIYTVLTKDQRGTWREMIGEEFKFATFGGGFGGGGGFGKKDGAKKDQ